VDILDDETILAFDGMEIDEEDKQAIIELLKFRRFQKGNNKNLHEGESVSFDITDSGKGPMAVNVQRL